MKVEVRDIMKDKIVKETDVKVIHFNWGWVGMGEDGQLQISIMDTAKYEIYHDYPKAKIELNIKEVK